MSDLEKELADTGAEYLLHLENMLETKRYGVREALQKAFQAGKTRGAIEGMETAKEIIRGTKS